eukprot:CAMPEP_0206614012 /NCGR_PEP_ID=MMETSP0325_2-20121206/57085_1 /ASSEMBLY_ACC=CAM_ASM_000347 /TAXON_ID=2866 /ORGANISM="Crypthecodinium cohnii, Strain Seligo" /LENGTH=79 /DNA_ID=CAMNT_0054134321 /DNA_START=379 /DNA_END=614 /DNA_ORIENTATION=-
MGSEDEEEEHDEEAEVQDFDSRENGGQSRDLNPGKRQQSDRYLGNCSIDSSSDSHENHEDDDGHIHTHRFRFAAAAAAA